MRDQPKRIAALHATYLQLGQYPRAQTHIIAVGLLDPIVQTVADRVASPPHQTIKRLRDEVAADRAPIGHVGGRATVARQLLEEHVRLGAQHEAAPILVEASVPLPLAPLVAFAINNYDI